MPNGELSPLMNAVRVSATPSPSVSRSNVIRFALGTPAPALPIRNFAIFALRPLPSSGLEGALVSATSTSPLGSVYTQRGCSSPVAKAATAKPDAATGLTPAGQPLAGAIFTVGTNDVV